ncbi:UDP-glucose 4-epimerase GalE [Fictibacillus sp. b24]|uniref:UDP-glucose 4-epimerase GalE n=1 Tax=Fictibacillus sp. b24 TaxID=3055863 RepID=UPI0025A2B429|nr:UDP-glucose 4-epimerase GalE [Fictibacillus sp. b24]MDM5314929.1 UDP-glucose 4-epimerase GalE [Fictibacillus sp. b24]
MILVVGGAGYIGSHTIKEILSKGFEVVVLDNLSTGHRESIDFRVQFVEGDLGNEELLDHVFTTYSIEAVMHFAANSLVGESVQDPAKYYTNNVAATLTLLQKMRKYNVSNFIFSSTAATYGIPDTTPITETTPVAPINPYGRSKLMVEHMLEDFHAAYGMNYVALRYFNAAGAYETGEIGEDHTPESHLIPIVLQHLLGQRETISVFGTDYHTADGTCIRDYIHVTDLAKAHVLSLESLLKGNNTNAVYNLGTGRGYSVREIIETCENVTGIKATIVETDRRAGDPDELVASADKIHRELGWTPEYSLERIIESAWNWHKSHPAGYKVSQ